MRDVQLMWVMPYHEWSPNWDQLRQTEVVPALEYWRVHGHPTRLLVPDSSYLIGDPFVKHTWIYQWHKPPLITCCLINNVSTGRQVNLGGGISSYGWCYAQSTLFACIRGLYRPTPPQAWISLGAGLCHELGHAFGYNDGDPNHRIMRQPDLGWNEWITR